MGGTRRWLPNGLILMTTKAYLPDGSTVGGEETVLVLEEDDENYYGLFHYNGRTIKGVRFPKDETRPLTEERKREFWFVTYLGARFG